MYFYKSNKVKKKKEVKKRKKKEKRSKTRSKRKQRNKKGVFPLKMPIIQMLRILHIRQC